MNRNFQEPPLVSPNYIGAGTGLTNRRVAGFDASASIHAHIHENIYTYQWYMHPPLIRGPVPPMDAQDAADLLLIKGDGAKI